MNPHQNSQSALVDDWSRFKVVAKNDGFVTSYTISNKLQKGYKKYIALQAIEIISRKIGSSDQNVRPQIYKKNYKIKGCETSQPFFCAFKYGPL